MTGSAPVATSDERLLREALAVVRSARDRAPTDFLVALAIVLGALALVLGAVGLLTDGVAQDLSLNLAAEVGGALLTVILIDGLWDRQQTGAADRLRRMETAIQARLERSTVAPIAPGEREGWAAFVAEYRELTRRDTVLDRFRAARGYGRRAHALETRGAALLGLDI